jgi:hypothetical protein
MRCSQSLISIANPAPENVALSKGSFHGLNTRIYCFDPERRESSFVGLVPLHLQDSHA